MARYYRSSIQKTKKLSFKKAVLTFLILGTGGGLIFWFLFSGTLAFQEVVVKVPLNSLKNSLVKQKVESLLNQKIFRVIPHNNFFLVKQQWLNEQLKKDFLEIDKVVVKKDFFKKKLDLEISLRKPLLIWCFVKECFYVDREGIFFKKAPWLYSSSMPIVQDDRSVRGKISETELEGIVILHKSLFSFSRFQIVNETDFKAFSSGGWEAKFSFTQPIDEQLSNLVQVWERRFQKSPDNLDYIDLRIPGRVYYKLKSTP